jgi:hypothetical protein
MLVVLKHDLIRRSRLIKAVGPEAFKLKVANNKSSVASKKSILWSGNDLPITTIYENFGAKLRCLN